MSLTTPLSAADATIISAGFLANLQAEAKIASQTNRNYTGQIVGKGSSVKVILPDLVTLADYVPGVTTITPTAVSDTDVTITADQAKYWAVSLDDVIANAGAAGELDAVAGVDAHIAAGELDAVAGSAGRTTALAVDAHIAGVWAANAGVDLGTDVDISAAGAAYEFLLDTTVELADKGTDLVAFVPTAFKAKLLVDSRFVGTGFTAQYNAQVGQVANVSIIECNVQGADTILVRSHAEAVASVVSLNKVERYRPESTFSDAVKGLVVYGAKVVREDCTAAGTVVYTAGA